MRRALATGAIAVALLGFGAGPAAADPGGARGGAPASPPGLATSGAERPEQAEEPQTGPINRVVHPPQAENP
jgi:hypothetical protein